MSEKQKPTTELYRLMYSICMGKITNPDELRKAKFRVNEIRGFNFFKGME